MELHTFPNLRVTKCSDVADLKEASRKAYDIYKNSRHCHSLRDSWYGFYATEHQQFLDLLDNPYTETWDLFLKTKAKLEEKYKNLKIVSNIRKRRMTDTDGEVSVEHFMRGDPSFYEQHYRKHITVPANQSLTLIIDLFASAYVEPENVTIRSSYVSSLVDILESNGIRVQIYVNYLGINFFSGPNDSLAMAKIKELEDVLDSMELLKLTSVWMMRGFAMRLGMLHKLNVKPGFGGRC